MNEEEIHKILDILKRESEDSVEKWVLVNYGSSEELDIGMDRLSDHLTEIGKRDFLDWVKSECGVEWDEKLSVKDKRRAVKKAMETKQRAVKKLKEYQETETKILKEMTEKLEERT
jgi:P2-related tail formation protein